ncbi:MAG: putative transcriptional regulator, arsR family [Rickettsiales bacterium]|jgi:DNA-binding transcriptional ArsR family regulator|nr:putative transcriptional regulator, arsR family [Rickettsiales bacterium]
MMLFMTQFVHPSKDDITLAGVLSALGDPVRLRIVQTMINKGGCTSCSEASPCPSVPKSTLSHHFRILRESGLVRTTKQGVEHRNVIRAEDIEERLPGLLTSIMKLAAKESAGV